MLGTPCYAVLHYVGRDFAGWQRQPSKRTVQGELEAVLERLTGSRVVTHAAGRTDAGVHALGQVVSFRMPSGWDPAQLLRALNSLLPVDVWAARTGHAPEGFHARKHAEARIYRYVVGCDAAAFSPFRRPFEWALGADLDARALQDAAAALAGEHDFRAFCAVGQPKSHYRCRILIAEWEARRDGEGFIFHIEADRFLHRMVRFLVGTMVDIGRGRRPASDVASLLLTTHNSETSPPAPPQGLYLMGARYPQLERAP
ncbi:MAG: tRNA pseudouridine(38-40) synthase TruA [Gemmatimonadetes bacterium]|nr:tRNA pseudouridine(38-40) synthase TruA [Gemmatimonadota bacterium]